jgi:curved DNA-binding protein CbpA
MAKGLPDYHRILGIEPDASLQAVKDAHRRLMVEMKMHPDLGGDHLKAAEINEAYSVLGDKLRRAEYKRTAILSHIREASAPALPNPESPLKLATSAPTDYCPFCRAEVRWAIFPETRCIHCRSPLAKPPMAGEPGSEKFGRRSGTRTEKSNHGTLFTAEYPAGLVVKMRDLSISGISFFSEAAFRVNQVFRFSDSTLDAVASVVSCHKQDKCYAIHSRLVTVAFHHEAGVFLSTKG